MSSTPRQDSASVPIGDRSNAGGSLVHTTTMEAAAKSRASLVSKESDVLEQILEGAVLPLVGFGRHSLLSGSRRGPKCLKKSLCVDHRCKGN